MNINLEQFAKEVFPRLPEKLRKKFSIDDMREICLALQAQPVNKSNDRAEAWNKIINFMNAGKK